MRLHLGQHGQYYWHNQLNPARWVIEKEIIISLQKKKESVDPDPEINLSLEHGLQLVLIYKKNSEEDHPIFRILSHPKRTRNKTGALPTGS